MPIPRLVQIWHRHYFYYQACPAGEMLRTLALTRFGIILFPGEASARPLGMDSINEIFA